MADPLEVEGQTTAELASIYQRWEIPLDTDLSLSGRQNDIIQLPISSDDSKVTSSSTPQRRSFRIRRSQRKAVLGIALALATLVFVVNLVVLVLFHTKWPIVNGFGVIFTGDCRKSSHINTALHLGINILSTLLMSTSNMCMQLLAAPTRDELDLAHQKERWLDIGTPSVRNLRYISVRRVLVWCLLGLSSVPLHFL